MTDAFANSEALWIIAAIVGSLSLLVVTLLVLVFIHHFFSDRQRNKNRQRFQQATEFLLPTIVSTEHDLLATVVKARQKYGERAVSLVLRRVQCDLKDEYARRVSAALEDLGVVDRLLKQSKSRKEWKRIEAVRALSECGGPIAREGLLEAAAGDESGMVRRFARDGLIRQGLPETLQAAVASFLEDLAQDASWHHAFYGRLAASAPGELVKLAESGQLAEDERKLAIEALADAGYSKALPLTVSLLRAEEPEIRATATRAIGKIGEPEHISLLRERLADEEWFIRAAAARSIESRLIAHREEVNGQELQHTAVALSRYLLDKMWWVRANSARALSYCGDSGIDMLFKTAEGQDRYARDAALGALAMTPLDDLQQAKLEDIMAAALAEQAQIREGTPA